MPFKSKAQRAYLYANAPDVAKKFEEMTPSDAKLPEHVKPKGLHGKVTKKKK